MGEHRELLLGLFDEAARRAVETAAQIARQSSCDLIDSQILLAALTRDTSLWDAAYLERIRAGSPRAPASRTETAGEAMTRGMSFSREAETVLTEAVERARKYRRSGASAADVLWALGESGGSDATHWLRAATGEPDPWRPVRLHLLPRAAADGVRAPDLDAQTPFGESPLRDENYLRMVALVYVLLRDEVLPGKFAKIVRELNGIEDISQAKFSSHELQALAASYVDDLWR